MWTEAPIAPDWILAGTPRTRSQDLHASYEGGVSMNFWDCTTGRFEWHFHGDEMVQILEGEVHVTFENGETRTLRTGDTAHFEADTTMVWDVPVYVRKLAFHRSPRSLPDRVFTRAMRTVRRLPVLDRRRRSR